MKRISNVSATLFVSVIWWLFSYGCLVSCFCDLIFLRLFGVVLLWPYFLTVVWCRTSVTLFSYCCLVSYFCDLIFLRLFGVVLRWPYFHSVLSKRKLAMEVQKNTRNFICLALKRCLEAALTNPPVFRTSGFQQRILVYLSDYIAISIFLLPSSRYNFSVRCSDPLQVSIVF